MISNVAAIAHVPLARALQTIERYFDAAAIADKAIDAQGVLEYYRQCDRAYRRYHSRAGALHIGLVGPGAIPKPGDHGHARHAELFAQQLAATGATKVIELGCGTGYNARLLASGRPSLHVTGVDLSPAHIAQAQGASRGLRNVEFLVANYEQLDLAPDSYDAALAIETLCQTGSQEKALRGAYHLLRPGGRLMVIDCFRNAPLDSFDPLLARGAVLVEKTAAVDSFAVIKPWLQLAESIGFQEIEVVDRSSETAYDLTRLYQLAQRFFNMSPVAKLLRHAMPPLAQENAICGLLMPYTVGLGVHGYYSIVLEKP